MTLALVAVLVTVLCALTTVGAARAARGLARTPARYRLDRGAREDLAAGLVTMDQLRDLLPEAVRADFFPPPAPPPAVDVLRTSRPQDVRRLGPDRAPAGPSGVSTPRRTVQPCTVCRAEWAHRGHVEVRSFDGRVQQLPMQAEPPAPPPRGRAALVAAAAAALEQQAREQLPRARAWTAGQMRAAMDAARQQLDQWTGQQVLAVYPSAGPARVCADSYRHGGARVVQVDPAPGWPDGYDQPVWAVLLPARRPFAD